jgi:hypothetical protein
MTRRQKAGLSVLLGMLDKATRDLENAKSNATAEAAKLQPDGAAWGGDIAIRLGVMQGTVEFNAKTLRAIHEQLLELFPSVEVMEL